MRCALVLCEQLMPIWNNWIERSCYKATAAVLGAGLLFSPDKKRIFTSACSSDGKDEMSAGVHGLSPQCFVSAHLLKWFSKSTRLPSVPAETPPAEG